MCVCMCVCVCVCVCVFVCVNYAFDINVYWLFKPRISISFGV